MSHSTSDVSATPATAIKRQQLMTFIESELHDEPAVRAVIGIGSIASGLARPDSDIDGLIFLHPFDLYAVPAEFAWRRSTRTFHSIFSHEAEMEDSVQLDFTRFDLARWRNPAFDWPEERRAELADGWIAFDRDGEVAQLIREHTRYDDALRQTRLDEAIVWLDQHLDGYGPQVRWDSLGPTISHDRLTAAYGYLVQALFAYNRRWRPWRNREMTALLRLPWLPADFTARVPIALNAPSLDVTGYWARAETLRGLFDDIVAQLRDDGEYPADAISAAFIRSHDEPGRAWNIDEWSRRHAEPRHPGRGL
jgi:hypothetical protein